MWGLAAVIPIVCCLLIPAVIAVAAFTGLGKKKEPRGSVQNDEAPQESSGYSTRLE